MNQDTTIGERNGQAESAIKSRPEVSIPATANGLVGGQQPRPRPGEFTDHHKDTLSLNDDITARADAVAAASVAEN